MTKTARKLFSELSEASLDGTELLVVEKDGRKFKKTGAGGGGVSWVKKTTAYTMSANEGVICDPNGTAFTVTAPATIAEGDVLEIHNFNRSATAALITFARNGHTLRFKGTDVAADITIDDGETLVIVCTDATNMEIV